MGQKFQREYLKYGSQLASDERSVVETAGRSIQDDRLYKVYVIEDMESGKKETRGAEVAPESLKD